MRENGVLSMLMPGDVTMVRRRWLPSRRRLGARPLCASPRRVLPLIGAPGCPSAVLLHGILLCFFSTKKQERIEAARPRTIILSGGPNSVHVEGAPRVPEGFFEYCAAHDIPVLGICYGMQVGGERRRRRRQRGGWRVRQPQWGRLRQPCTLCSSARLLGVLPPAAAAGGTGRPNLPPCAASSPCLPRSSSCTRWGGR